MARVSIRETIFITAYHDQRLVCSGRDLCRLCACYMSPNHWFHSKMSLLPTVLRNTASPSTSRTAAVVYVCLRVAPPRSFATDSSSTPSSSSTSSPDRTDHIPPLPNKPKNTRSRLYPHPRPASVSQIQSSSESSSLVRYPPSLKHLPPTFGRNQLLPVSNNTRALLESIVANFEAPIRYAFAYGSGVFEQDGYGGVTLPAVPPAAASTSSQVPPAERGAVTEGTAFSKQQPMVDFMFAVTHPAHFHSINMQQFPSHYPFHARLFGSSYVSRLQKFGPGVWFNAYIPMKGVVCNLPR